MRFAPFSLLCTTVVTASALHGATDGTVPGLGQNMEVRRAIVAPPDGAPSTVPATGASSANAPATPVNGQLVPGATAPEAKPVEPRLVYVRCEVQQPAIAITFDDGPHPDFTPRLLDILKKENIKATFFMVGRCVVTYPDIVKRMVDEGHEVASHSWSHPLLTSLGNTSLDSQMRKTHDAIIKACGVTPTLYRPPYGASRLAQRKRIHDEFGYASILWDVDPLDWQRPRTSQKVQDRILAQTRPGSIILCHDIHETTVDAMPATLAQLKARGYQFMTVSQLIDLEAKTPRIPGVPIAAAPLPAVLPLSATDPEGAPAAAQASVQQQTNSDGGAPAAQPQAMSVPAVPPARTKVEKPVKLKPSERLSLELPGESKP